MTAYEFLVAVVAEAQAAALLLLDCGQALDRPAHGDGSRGGRRHRGGRWKGETLNGSRQEATRGSAGWRRGVLLPQLQLAGQTHRAGEGLRVVDLDVEAEQR